MTSLPDLYGGGSRPIVIGLVLSAFASMAVFATLVLPTDGGRAEGGRSRASEKKSFSPALLLSSAEARGSDSDGGEQEFVDFCFERKLLKVSDTAGFFLLGPRVEDRVQAQSARLVQDRPRCVLAGFPAGTDVSSFTLGMVSDGAVANRGNEVNVLDSSALITESPARPQLTAAPDLIGLDVKATRERIEFKFDELLHEGTGNKVRPEAFGYYTLDGTAHLGDAVAAVDEESVAVDFFDYDDQVEEARRIFVVPGAVRDGIGNRNIFGQVGRRTTKPDLVGVRSVRGRRTQFEFSFDEPVAQARPARFLVYTAGVRAFPGQVVARPGPRIVRVTFPQIDEFKHQVTLAAVANATVRSNEASQDPSTIGTRRVASADPGATLGPDLLSARLRPRTSEVVFRFDQKLDQDHPDASSRFEARPELFRLISRSGRITAARAVIDLQGRRAVVAFASNVIDAARAATVHLDAVRDYVGNPNPPASVRLD